MRQYPSSSMRMRMAHNPFLFSVVATALLLAGCSGRPQDETPAPGVAGESGPRPAAAALTVTTTPVVRQELVRTVPATGSIFPWQEVVIGPEVGGYRVAEVLVDVGSRVRAGQVLVRLSDDLLQADLASKQ